jgi:hypothetical protein
MQYQLGNRIANNLDVLRIWQASIGAFNATLAVADLDLVLYYLPTQTQTACNFIGHAHAYIYFNALTFTGYWDHELMDL